MLEGLSLNQEKVRAGRGKDEQCLGQGMHKITGFFAGHPWSIRVTCMSEMEGSRVMGSLCRNTHPFFWFSGLHWCKSPEKSFSVISLMFQEQALLLQGQSAERRVAKWYVKLVFTLCIGRMDYWVIVCGLNISYVSASFLSLGGFLAAHYMVQTTGCAAYR